MGLRRWGMMDGQTIHPVDTYVIYPHANGVSTAIVQMSANTKYVLLDALCALTLVVIVACGGEFEPLEAVKAPFQNNGSASVEGTVTYRESIKLSPDARLIMELQDVSYADADSIPIASRIIPNPGQVPIDFKINYDRESIDLRNRYAIQARIIGSDGRLAFINDTAYEVITRGKPSRVDMVLVLVQPPPEMVGDSDWRTWVEVPVHVNGAELLRSGPDQYLRILYNRSTIDGCSRPGAEEVVVDGADIIARVTLMQPPDTPWAIPCDEQVVEMDTILSLNAELEAGETYRVIVNDRKVTTIAMPPAHSTR